MQFSRTESLLRERCTLFSEPAARAFVCREVNGSEVGRVGLGGGELCRTRKNCDGMRKEGETRPLTEGGGQLFFC